MFLVIQNHSEMSAFDLTLPLVFEIGRLRSRDERTGSCRLEVEVDIISGRFAVVEPLGYASRADAFRRAVASSWSWPGRRPRQGLRRGTGRCLRSQCGG